MSEIRYGQSHKHDPSSEGTEGLSVHDLTDKISDVDISVGIVVTSEKLINLNNNDKIN